MTGGCGRAGRRAQCLNGVRPRRPEQYHSWLKGYMSRYRLNGVRPRRPEQFGLNGVQFPTHFVSMESGLEGRNNLPEVPARRAAD